MSDVERICYDNHNRVRWAEEYADQEKSYVPSKRYEGKRRRRIRRLRSVSTMCSTISGMAAAFVGIGLATMNFTSIIVGVVTAVVFITFGYAAEVSAEESERGEDCDV